MAARAPVRAQWPLGRFASTAFVVSLYCVAVASAEVVGAYGDARLGSLLHGITLLFLLNHAALLRRGAGWTHGSLGPALIALSLVPILRLMSFVMPVSGLPRIYDYALTGAALALAVGLGVRAADATHAVARLLTSVRWTQALVAASGVPLGLAAYLAVEPEPVVADVRSLAAVAAVVVLGFGGALEEIVFRGVVQQALSAVLGRVGIVVAALLYGATYLGIDPKVYAVFALASGLAFGVVVERTKSLVGVTFARALMTIGSLLAWPHVLA